MQNLSKYGQFATSTGRIVKSAILSFALFALSLNAGSQILYVGPNGNDSNSGTTPETPLASITKAGELAKPGDKIMVRGGVYKNSRTIEINCKGTKEKPITFTPYGEERPVLDFADIGEKGKGGVAILFPTGTQYVVFDGFEIANGHSTGVRMIHCSNITFRNCIVHDFDQVGLSVASDECLVENNEFYRICMAFENCNKLSGGWPQVVNTSAKPPIPPAIIRSHAYNNVFRGNHVHHCWGEGIDPMFSDGAIVENNIIHDVFSVGIYLDGARNAIIRNNYIYSTDDVRNRADSKMPATGILMGSEYFGGWGDYPAISHIENIYIYNNVLSRVGTGIGHWIDKNNTDRKNIYENVKIFNNTVDTYEGRGDGIRFADNLTAPTSGNECRNNIFRASKRCIAEPNFIFENNLWVNGIPEQGKHINSFAGDAGWVNPGQAGDFSGYKLLENSPCIGKGQPIEGLVSDKFGRVRPTPLSLGAIEAENNHGTETHAKPVASVANIKYRPVPNFHVGVNIALNPHFDEVAKGLPLNWKIEGDAAAFSMSKPGYMLGAPNMYGKESLPKTDNCVKLGLDGKYKVAMVQKLLNIPAGRYGLHIRVKRFGESGDMYAEISGYGGEPIRCNIPLAKNMDEWSDYSKKFFQLNISDIEIPKGKCTIRVFASGNKDDSLLVDDVVLYRY